MINLTNDARLTSQPAPGDADKSTYERLGQMLRRENLKPTARFLGAAYLGYNLCRMERDGQIATPTAPHPDRESVPTYKTMAELRAQRADPAADLYERFPELRQWQQDRSEWHDDTILEIVSEFIEWWRNPTTDTQSDWTGGRAWPEMLDQVAEYFAEFEQERAGAGIYSQEEIAELAGEFATGLADHLASTDTQSDAVRDGPEITYEVWEDDFLVASSSSLTDAGHYLAVYSQNAEFRFVKAETYRTPIRNEAADTGGKA
jgi:hypothetical protein